MRLLIRMLPLESPASLPLDNYPFASALYRAIWVAAPDYAEFLHDEGYPVMRGAELESGEWDEEGYPHKENKRFKFFVFSRIEQRGKRIAKGRQWLRGAPVDWQVSSPIDGLMEMLAAGLASQGVIRIGDKFGGSDLGITEIYQAPDPEIASEMRFKTISPIFAAVDERKEDGSRTRQHLRVDDGRYESQIVQNLIRKYRTLNGIDPNESDLEFRYEGEPKSQLVQFRGTNHHSYLGRIVVRGSRELIRLGWECGFGEANSKGFGMVEAAD